MSGPVSRHTRQLLDGALDGALDAPSQSRLAALLRTDPQLRVWFDAERRTLAALKEVSPPGDMTGAILSAVQSRRAFLSRSARWRVWTGRGALAASLLLAAAGIAVLQRAFPQAVPWSAGPGPVSDVENTVRADAASGLRTVAQAVDELQKQATGPLAAPDRHHPRSAHPELGLGPVSGYESNRSYGLAGDVPSASGGLSASQMRLWKLGVPAADEGFVISRATWTDRSASQKRALRTHWEAGAAMQLNDDAPAIERSWLLRFWMNSQTVQGGGTER